MRDRFKIWDKYNGPNPADVNKLDLTDLTMCSDRVITSISVKNPYDRAIEWISCGAISIQRNDRTGIWTVQSYMDGLRDSSYSSAIAFRLSLVGFEFKFMSCGVLFAEAFIRTDSPDDFLIPPPDWDQFKGAIKDKVGDDMFTEDRWVPPINEELWLKLRGYQVDIRTGPINTD